MKEQCLNGKWDFRPDGEECCSKIYVPSQWTHGDCFGYPKSWESVKKADYSRTVLLPEFGSEDFLAFCFDSVMLKCLVFLDGVNLGGHAGGFTPFEVRIPERLWKKNSGQKVVLKVEVESAVAAFTDEGVMHQVGYPEAGEEGPLPGGIWQSVYLRQRPKLYVASWSSKFKFQSRKSVLECVVENAEDADFCGCVEFVVCDLKSGKVLQKLESCLNIQKCKEAHALCRFILPAKFKLWSAFEPNLYGLQITIYDSNGCEVDSFSDRIGFREVVIKGRNVILNGDAVRMFGLSLIRQRVSPYLWREDYLRLYFSELKKMGFNALRLHGAIAPPIVLELADELGIMLINQSSIWTGVHAGYRKGGKQFLTNTKREFDEWHMRDRNHPSVLIWDVENEQISVNVKNIPWVNELIRYMRRLTGQPISASASGLASESDIAHLHCAGNLNRLLKHSIKKPFFAGEWWGPEKEYRQKMHSSARKLNDLASMEDIEKSMGHFFEKEILLQRMMGAAGTFPFATELFFFRPLFEKGEKLDASSDNSENNPIIKFADNYSGYSYHTPRRPLVNPGWSKNKPAFILGQKMVACFKRALKPIVIMECEKNCDFYGEESLFRSFKLINDSSYALSGSLSAEFTQGKKKCKVGVSEKTLKNLKTGKNKRFSVKIDLPKVKVIEKGRLVITFKPPSGGKILRTLDSRVWPKLPLAKPQLPVYTVGVKKNVEYFLKGRGIEFKKISLLPDCEAVLIIGDGFSVNSEDFAKFTANGGRAIILRQSRYPDFIAHPFKFKSADEAIKPVLENIQKDSRQLNFATSARIFNKKHKVFQRMQGREIRPFACNDHRIIDDAFYRPCISKTLNSGPYKILAEGADRSQVALSEIPHGEGITLMCQFLLEENLLRDPQADRLFFNMLDYASKFRKTPERRIVCSSRKLAKTLSEITEHEIVSQPSLSLLKNNDIAILSSWKNILEALNRKESQKGAVIILGEQLKREEFSSFFEIIDIKESAPLATINSVENSPFGWNSLDIEKSLAEASKLKRVLIPKSTSGFKSEIDVFSHSYDDPYGGASIGEKLGSVLLSKKTEKGTIYITTLPLLHCANPQTICLWHSLLSSFNADSKLMCMHENNAIVSVTTPPLPLDGDFHKWFNGEVDKHIAPWSCGEPVLLDASNIVKGSGEPLKNCSSGAVCCFMHDKNNLYFSACMISDEFDFEEVEVFTYNKDSVQVFLNDVQFVFSARSDGSFFMDSRGLKNGSQKQIAGVVKLIGNISDFPETANLHLDRNANLKALFLEVRIPRKVLPFELSASVKHEVAVALNIAEKGSSARHLQYSYPSDFLWDDHSTFGLLESKE